MTHRIRLLPATLVAFALLAAAPALAQGYRCSSAQGTYYSDRPCPIQGGTRLGSIGPAPEPLQRQHQPYTALPSRAPDHLSYMSSECASLNDGLRTAGSRGLSPALRSELQYDYQRRCAADESRARQRWSQEQRSDQVSQREKQAQATAAARREQVQHQQSTAQCGEMRRIISAKNERLASLTEGERSDLRRFEGNYAERCGVKAP